MVGLGYGQPTPGRGLQLRVFSLARRSAMLRRRLTWNVRRRSGWRGQDPHDALFASSLLLSLGAAFARMKKECHGRPSGSLQALCTHFNPSRLIVVASRSRSLTSRTGTTGVDVIVADYVILTEVDACLDFDQDHGHLSRVLHAMDRTKGNVD
jgi:hypothetical protein